MTPKQEEEKMNEIFCYTMQRDMKDGTTYMNCTGKIPVRSNNGMMTMFIIYHWSSNSILAEADGMVKMFIMYDWSSNSILVEVISNTKDETIINVFKEKINYLTKRRFKPRFIILDNIASRAIIEFLKEECNIGIQIVKLHNHRINVAESNSNF